MKFNPQTHTYTENGRRLLSVTEILRRGGLAPLPPVADLEWYADRGSKIHRATALLDQGVLDWSSVDPRIKGYVRAWAAFRDETGFRPKAIERPIRHKDLGYAGTPDRVGLLNRLPAVIDIKTGAIPPWTEYQLAAYTHILGGDWWRIAVRISKDGKFSMKPYSRTTFRQDLGPFLEALAEIRRKECTQQQQNERNELTVNS